MACIVLVLIVLALVAEGFCFTSFKAPAGMFVAIIIYMISPFIKYSSYIHDLSLYKIF